MLIHDARSIAHQWVEEHAAPLPGFAGAYLSGSMTVLPDEAVLPDASDIDIKILIDATEVDADIQKCLYRGAVIDVSHGSLEHVRTPEAVLGTYYTAVHFMHPCILSDPTGHLAAIREVVQREYPRREWVRARCEHAARQLQETFAMLVPSGAIHDQVFAWLFPVVFTPPMVLVADLRNPTHRRGMATLNRVLTAYGHPDLHEQVLGISGSQEMSRAQVETILAACAEAFDAAVTVHATPFLLASNISDFARPIAIGGAQELIAEGHHREAVPWIAFIHTLCQTILQHDAPEAVRDRFTSDYVRLLDALGIPSYDALVARHDDLLRLIPNLWDATEHVMATNPAIVE
jgi:hypothetical protein